MAIVKMKFVSACTDQEHLDQMLLTGLHSGMLQPVAASSLITEENGGQEISTENPYHTYVETMNTIAHSASAHLKKKETFAAYTDEEIEAYLKELNTEFQLNADSAAETLSQEDEKALSALAVCGFERMNACQYLNFGFGRMPMEGFKKLTLYSNENFVRHTLYENSQYVWLVYVTSDNYAAATAKIFQSLFFEPIALPKIDLQERVRKSIDKMNDVYSFCLQRDEICSLYPNVCVFDDKQVLSGFVKDSDLQLYEAQFKDQPVTFDAKDPSEVRQCTCPTLLKNGWFAKPFELYVEMYSLPAYEDFDPTPFLAITYCLMFGIMFGDLGQGLVLLIIGLLFEKKGKLFGIIGRCGITSMIFGFLFGSVFGYENALNPIHQGIFHVREKLFDVMANSNTMVLLMGAIAIGAVLILSSMILNIWNNARHRKYGEMLFSQNGIAGVIFYGYIIAAAAMMLIAGNRTLLSPVFIVLFAVLPVICFIMKGAFTRKLEGKPMKPEEGWGGYFTENVFEALEILLSFITNSMSYLRVGGFVLSHAGMMLVVMTLAQMTGGASIAVVIFGNAFVMVLEGLIVGIQALRLEYYEMFSRYYTGGGTPYRVFTAAEAE
ncbi:MAG: ATPase V [Erysipelotrichia bacterium]|nr:ATPase V [Erysipelotrichia bacterium]